MAASAFLVQLEAANTGPKLNGCNAAVVYAATSADAIAIAKAGQSGDNDAGWDAASVTAIAPATDLSGYVLRIATVDTSPVIDVAVTGGASATVDSMGSAIAAALSAAGRTSASYTASANLVTVAVAAESLGAKDVVAEFKTGGVAIPSLLGTVTDKGAAGAALTVALVTDSPVVPAVAAFVRVPS